MPLQLDDPLLKIFVGGTFLLSTATCLMLVARRRCGPLLVFEPRTLVPWNAVGAVLASVFVLLALATVTAPKASPETVEATPRLIMGIVQEVILVGGVLACVAVHFRATLRDLGLPATRQELAHDVALGGVVALAALAPVRLIQGLLLLLWGGPEMESGHPLVKMLANGKPDLLVMLLASIMAVVVAPACEEVVFRLLLQGWLEKWETVKLGLCPESSSATEGNSHGEAATTVEVTNGPSSQEPADSSFVNRQLSLDSLPAHGLAGLPFGWFPIIVTSVLFGLAHFGYGPEPLPLFVLALMLGYVYQRTHRIVPCVVAHAIFNAFTMVALWRIVFHAT